MQDMHNNLIEKQVKDLSRHFFFPKENKWSSGKQKFVWKDICTPK